jgi:hypothetical protein
MKTNAKSIMAFSAITIVALAIAFWSFKKPENTHASLKELKSTMLDGKWQVNLYRDNGADETNNYTGYEFKFYPNGTVSAWKNNVEETGSWKSVREDESTKVYMEFDPTSHLNELSEDWLVILNTNKALVFEDFTTGHSGSDYLSFQKIS